MNQPIEARACYETLKDRLDAHEELSARLQLVLLEEHPVELLKMYDLLKSLNYPFIIMKCLEFKLL